VRWVVWGPIVLVAASGACSLATDLSLLGGDASVDAPVEAANDAFVLTASPTHVTLDPQDAIDVEIDIARGAAFSDIVDLTVNDVGGLSGITTTPATLTFTASTPVKLHLDVSATASTPQDGNITVLGIGRSTQKSMSVSFGVRVGTVLVDTQANATVPVPGYAKSVFIKAWGAGGGAGASPTISSAQNVLAVGGHGGGGGMAGALFATPAGSSLDIIVGAQGTTGGGGAGGGYTTVSLGSTRLLVAGGGGGGGQGHGDATFCNTVIGGGDALAGGGANAQTSARSGTVTTGGAAGDNNGAMPGTPLQGGSASPQTNSKTCVDGGAPGGGRSGALNPCGTSGGGGGGGGWFGGGGGGYGQGGGGGSGFVSDAGADVMQAAGTFNVPAATTDPDYRAGTATGGAANTDITPVIPATPGRVIVRLPKP